METVASLAISLPAVPVVAQPAPKLVAHWEMVDGKLTCRWFRTPD